jgi:hypothetical protein
VVACVVVEVKFQQRRPDGGSIPPIARISFCFCSRASRAECSFLLSEKASRFFPLDAGLGGGSCVPRLWGCICKEPREFILNKEGKRSIRGIQRRFLPVLQSITHFESPIIFDAKSYHLRCLSGFRYESRLSRRSK